MVTDGHSNAFSGGAVGDKSSRRALKPSLLILGGEVEPSSIYGGFRSLRTETGEIELPQNNEVYNEALRKVLLYMISDSLDLTSEEEIWLSWKLGEISLIVAGKNVVEVLLPVRQELLKGNYTQLLQNRREHFDPKRSNASLYSVNNVNASVDDWVDNILNIFQLSYEFSPLEELKIKGILTDIFINLGVDDISNPRGASYIPSDIKYTMFRKKLED